MLKNKYKKFQNLLLSSKVQFDNKQYAPAPCFACFECSSHVHAYSKGARLPPCKYKDKLELSMTGKILKYSLS